MKKLSSILTALVMSVCIQSNAHATWAPFSEYFDDPFHVPFSDDFDDPFHVPFSDDFDDPFLDSPTLKNIIDNIKNHEANKENVFTSIFPFGSKGSKNRRPFVYQTESLFLSEQIAGPHTIECYYTIDGGWFYRRLYFVDRPDEQKLFFSLSLYRLNRIMKEYLNDFLFSARLIHIRTQEYEEGILSIVFEPESLDGLKKLELEYILDITLNMNNLENVEGPQRKIGFKQGSSMLFQLFEEV